MPLNKLNVFVVIVTYNGEKYIKKCIDSIFKASFVPNIIIVDNKSTDSTVELLKKEYAERIVHINEKESVNLCNSSEYSFYLLENSQNDGFGKANNIGIKFALNQGADYVFLLNQDTWIFPDTIENLVNDMEQFPRIGILSPQHYQANETDLDPSFKRYSQHKATPLSKEIKRVPFVNAAAWMLRAKHIRMVGYFDEVFRHYGEDRNYCNRMDYNKFAIAITENAKIVHDREVQTSFVKDSKQSKYLLLNTFLDYNLSPFGQNLFAVRQTVGLPKYFLKKHGILKSLQLFFILVWFYFVDILYLKTHKKSSDEIKARIEQTFKPKQFFLFSGINYLGLLINVFATVFLFSSNLELLGKIRFIETIGTLLYPLFLLGSSYTLINYYNFLKRTNSLRKFLGDAMLLIFSTTAVALLVLSLVVYFYAFEYRFYAYLGVVFAGVLAFFELFRAKAQIVGKPLFPQFIEKIAPRLVLASLFLLLLNNFIKPNELLIVYLCVYAILVFVLYLSILKYIKPKFGSFKEAFNKVTDFKNSKTIYSVTMLLSSFGFLLAFRIDGFMIPLFLDMKQNGLFNIALILISFITIPATTLFAMSGPAISDLIDKNQFQALQRKFKQSAKLLLMIGGVIASIYFLFLPKIFASTNPVLFEYKSIVPVIQILTFSALINVATSFNSEIIMYSKHYRFNLFSILFLAVLSVVSNHYFLSYTNLGIVGVAYASAISLTLFNVLKIWYIYKKFKITPFDKRFFYLIILMLGVYFTAANIPTSTNSILSVVSRVGLVLVLNLSIIYKTKLVCVYTHFVRKYILKNLPENKNFSINE